MEKRDLSFFEIWNMSVGFLGIQFGFALQGGNMSRIFETLGAAREDIPGYWLMAPLAGLIIQPIIGNMSDNTWHHRFGRRRPYFFIGAVLASVALFVMPNSGILWVAVGMLLILDVSINISMEPFRALVADKLNENQRTYGFVVQTLIIGIGTYIASILPEWIANNVALDNSAVSNGIPQNVKYAFYVGGVVFMGAILYTIFTTKEYPPEDMDEFLEKKKISKESGFLSRIGKGIGEILEGIAKMPKTMTQLGIVQFFSWFAFFAMWSMATPALTEHVFHAPSVSIDDFNMNIESEAVAFEQAKTAYNSAADKVSKYMGTYGIASMVFALILVFISREIQINRKLVHSVALAAGGIGFVGMYFIDKPESLHYCFIGIGIAWASILSMPYAMLAGSIKENKMGLFMGLFNMFIVIPQICAGLGGVNLAYRIFGDPTISAILLAGTSLFIASACTWIVQTKQIS